MSILLWRLKTLRLRFRLRKKRRQLNELRDRLRAEGVSDEEAAIPIVAQARKIESVQADIELIRTGRLVRKAIRLGIDLPRPIGFTRAKYSDPRANPMSL